MPNPTRREREEALIVQMRKLSGTMDYVEGYTPTRNLYEDLDKLYAALESAHRREDKLRKVPRYGLDFCDRMEPDKDGAWIHEDDILRILDAHDVPQGGAHE